MHYIAHWNRQIYHIYISTWITKLFIDSLADSELWDCSKYNVGEALVAAFQTVLF